MRITEPVIEKRGPVTVTDLRSYHHPVAREIPNGLRAPFRCLRNPCSAMSFDVMRSSTCCHRRNGKIHSVEISESNRCSILRTKSVMDLTNILRSSLINDDGLDTFGVEGSYSRHNHMPESIELYFQRAVRLLQIGLPLAAFTP